MTASLRLRIAASCVLLVGLAFVQDPGFLVADTKFDLVAAPGDFLARALHLWDPEGAFGQLQNQAYGYLWPMGPFFLGGWLAAVPGWVVQRLWLALVMVTAFSGSARLARAFGVRSDLACIVAGFAFALSPRMLTTLGPISIEAWPSAVAPWVLLPLVLGSRSGSPRLAAALAAAAVAMVGGVNAAATFAVVPLGVVWLLTRTPGPRRRSLMFWWPVFTLLGTLWWLVPLFVMGAYSPPFLDFIETSTITTFPTTVFDVLRGTSNWVPYIDSSSRAGSDLLTTSYLALNSGLVLLLGLAGLLDRRSPERRFLALSLLLGVLMVGAGHEGSVHGWFAAPVGELLDGVLSPLRNVHKFDVILRLPLVLGLAFALDRVLSSDRREADPSPRSLVRLNQVTFTAMALVAVVGASLPAVQGRVAPQGATTGVPEYWAEAADWLTESSGDQTALLLPGTGFASYVWGSLRDEPLQYLADSRWAVRNAIPLAPPGNIRMLDGIEARLAQGDGSEGLTQALARNGVRYVVVRNDLARGSDVPDPVLVHQALARSPGLERVATFGPDVGGEGHLVGDEQRVLVNGGWQAVYPAIEIFEVPGSAAAVSGASLPVVAAGPEDLPDLADVGALGTGGVLLAADAPADLSSPSRVVLTDGLRARERSFARIHDGASAVIGPGDVRRSGNPTRDYLIDSADRWSTTASYRGAAALSASSSGSDAGEVGGALRGRSPFAAVDGRRATQWVSGLGRSGQSWWSVTLEEPLGVELVRLTGGSEAAADQVVRVRTDHALSDPVELGPGETRMVRLDGSTTSTLRVEDAQDTTVQPLALAEVGTPGLRVSRTLVLPDLPVDWGAPHRIVLRTDDDPRSGCVEVAADVRCVTGRSYPAEEPHGMDRTLSMSAPATYDAALVVSPRPGRALLKAALRDQPLGVATSTVGVPDVRASGYAAVDGDPGTSWVADPDDARPTITLSWLGTQTVSGLRLSVDPDTAARLPTRVTVTWPGGTRTVPLDDGRASFPAVRTDQLRVQVLEAERAVSLGLDAQASGVPVGIGELQVVGMPYAPLTLSREVQALPCGRGPEVVVNGFPFATRVTAAPADLVAGVDVPAELCLRGSETTPPVVLRAGENVVRTTTKNGFAVQSLVLDADSVAPAAATEAMMTSPSPVTRILTPDPGSTFVAMRENVNAGWGATVAGEALEPVVVDGWQQGWLLPAGSDEPVEATYAPDPTYRAGLLAGFAGLVVLLLALLVLLRRRGAEHPPLRERHVPWPVGLVVLVAGAGLVAGWPGLVVGAATVPLLVLLDRRAPEAAPFVLGACCLVAALDYVVTPWGSASGWAGNDRWPHYLALVPVLALVASALLLEPAVGLGRRRKVTFFSRSTGRSRTR